LGYFTDKRVRTFRGSIRMKVTVNPAINQGNY